MLNSNSTLLESKLLLLRWIANPHDIPFVHDKDFTDDIRRIFTQISSGAGNKNEINSQLNISFDNYQLGVIRALLSNLHFLHLTYELRLLFSDLFEKVNEYCKKDTTGYYSLLQELEIHSDSKSEVTQKFIFFLLEKLELTENQNEEIFINEKYSDAFKFLLFKINCTNPNNLKFLLKYFANYAINKPYYGNQVNLLIEEYAKTGFKGLELALINYKTGNLADNNGIIYHGTKLIAAFGDTLAMWLNNHRHITYKSLLEPIILSLSYMSPDNRNKSILILIRDWGKKNDILDRIRTLLRFQLITDQNFTLPLTSASQRMIYEIIQIDKQDKIAKETVSKLIQLNYYNNNREIELIINKATADIFFYSLLVPDSRFCYNIFQYILRFTQKYQRWDRKNQEQYDRIKEFRENIYNPEYFQSLPQTIKHALVAVPPFIYYMKKYKNRFGNLETRFDNIEFYCNPRIRIKVRKFIEGRENLKYNDLPKK